jgi:hypothetical protein
LLSLSRCIPLDRSKRQSQLKCVSEGKSVCHIEAFSHQCTTNVWPFDHHWGAFSAPTNPIDQPYADLFVVSNPARGWIISSGKFAANAMVEKITIASITSEKKKYDFNFI